MMATYNWSTGKYEDSGQEVSCEQVQAQYGIEKGTPCCEFKPAPIQKSNTFVNENGKLVKKFGKFSGFFNLAGYAIIELFSSHNDPAEDLQNAYKSAAEYNFRNGAVNEGLYNELLRNGYKKPSADEEGNDTYIYRGGAPTNGNITRL